MLLQLTCLLGETRGIIVVIFNFFVEGIHRITASHLGSPAGVKVFTVTLVNALE